MASKWASGNVFKALFYLCFLALLFQTLAFAEWLFFSAITWQSPIAHLVPVFLALLGAKVVALVVYFRRSWVAALVAWLDVALILALAIPWSSPSWHSVLSQYKFELVFLVFAHVAVWAYIQMNRAIAAEVEEVLGAPPETSGSES
jgi:hypothetical protein